MLFLARVATRLEGMVLVGSLRPPGADTDDAQYYSVPGEISFAELPYYSSLAHPAAVLSGGSVRRFWRVLDDVDAVWAFAPHPLAIVFALLAALRRRRVFLGIRQDTVAYMRSRHPDRPLLHFAARMIDGTFRFLARRFAVVTVGPELAQDYARAPRRLEMVVSLVEEADLVEPEASLARDFAGELRVLSVGRLDTEKNPLLLADVAALLHREDARWRLVVCGDGQLKDELAARLEELGVADRAELLGYVPFGEELTALYRSSHVLLHTSWTEGLPQVLTEAFAAGLPVVAADVGGIRAAVGEAALLVPPGDPEAAARAVRSVATDAGLRERLVRAGSEYARAHTIEAEATRVAGFLEGA